MSGRLQLAGDGAESGAEVGSDQGERRDCCHRYQCGNQRVLYRRYTLLILDQFPEEHVA